MIVSSFNGLKCVVGNKKCKSSGLLRPYENQDYLSVNRNLFKIFERRSNQLSYSTD
jgi:hypothetical protein